MPTVRLENKDCFDFLKELPSETIDLAILDPPYIISRKTGYMKGGDEKFHYST